MQADICKGFWFWGQIARIFVSTYYGRILLVTFDLEEYLPFSIAVFLAILFFLQRGENRLN